MTTFPVTVEDLDARIDQRLVLQNKAKTVPPLTSGQKHVVAVFLVFILVSCGVWYVGWTAFRDEVDARIAGQCHVILQVRDSLRQVLNIATTPRSEDTAMNDPDRLKAIRDLNAQLATAREKYAPAIDALSCQ